MRDYIRQSLKWDDLQVVLSVARAGSFAGAAAALGISTPTLFRRANALEERLGTLIFRRDTTGVSLTPAGLDAAALAERIEADVSTLEARIGNDDADPGGTIRFASVDTLMAGPLMSILAGFRRAHPAILLDLATGIRMADLKQREVDAALRAGGEPPESLVGRRLSRIAVAVYQAASSPAIGADEFDRQSWIVPNDELAHLASSRWLKDRGHAQRAALRVNSLHSLAVAVAEGIGLGIVPCYLADRDPRLVRVGDPIDELASDLWFLTHAELRHATRIRALSDYLAAGMQALRPLFHGDRPVR